MLVYITVFELGHLTLLNLFLNGYVRLNNLINKKNDAVKKKKKNVV